MLRFVVSMDNNFCRKGGIVVAKCVDTHGKQYIEVGDITDIDKNTKKITFKLRRCTADPWTPACLTSAWHAAKGKNAKTSTIKASSVIGYYEKLISKSTKLPKAATEQIKASGIVWTPPEEA